MSKKSNKKKSNPVYRRGVDVGIKQGIARTNSYYLDKITEYSKTKGIGFLTVMKLVDLMGREPFMSWIIKNAPKEWLEKEGIESDEKNGIR